MGTDTDAFRADICAAVNDFATKDIQKVLADLPQISAAVSKCPADAQADFAVIANWYKFWRGQGEMKVYQTAYKNIVGNMSTLKADADKISNEYTSGDFYAPADTAAEIAKLALPVQAAELLQ